MPIRALFAATALAASVVSLTPATDAIAKHRSLPTIYGGSTSDDGPFGLQVSRDHRHLVRLVVHAAAQCPNGGHAAVSGAAPFVAKLPKGVTTANTMIGNRLRANGTFSAHGVAVQDYGERAGLVTESLSGHVRGRSADGTFQLTVSVIEANTGRTVETCRSDTLHWSAKAAPGRRFVGLTANRQPVVLALSSDGLVVSDLWIGWNAACQPDGTVATGDHFGHFRVSSGGGFGAGFDAGPFTNDDGSASSLHYEVHGTVKRTSASGTFAATMTQVDATGATVATCTLPEERWKAFG